MAFLDHLKYRTACRAFVRCHAAEISAALAEGYSAAAIYRAFIADGNPPPVKERQFRTLIGRLRKKQKADKRAAGKAGIDEAGDTRSVDRSPDHETAHYDAFRRSLDGLDPKTQRERVAERFVSENDNPLFKRREGNTR